VEVSFLIKCFVLMDALWSDCFVNIKTSIM
jgi:hypothetical protein